MPSLTEPFAVDFMARALLGGSLIAVIAGIVGTWVVIRGMAFLGEAIGHGMLPGVALATVLGLPVMLGAAVSAAVMSSAITLLQRRGRLSYDTSIGLLFVGMLALGVIIVSHSRSFATDATAILFGDVLATTSAELLLSAVALAITVVIAVGFHRSFVASSFDPRIARVLGLRPALAQGLLVGLVTLAVVTAYQAVGTLLVIGLLLAPAVAAGRWARRIPVIMIVASIIGIVSVYSGLLLSWHTGTAAGASIALIAVGIALASTVLRGALIRVRGRLHPAAAHEDPRGVVVQSG